MAVEHFDVLIIGAGISGIGAGRYLKTELPGKTFAILEARGASGGTWDLFRYPGTRSDSDLHTFGYAFKPWRDKEAIASAPRILAYLRETATENGLDPHIRYHHRVRGAAFDSETALWTVSVERAGEPVTLTARWVFAAGGYYRYDEGFTPELAGPRPVPGHHRAPAALAGRPRLRGQAGRRGRQRRDRGHHRARDGRHRRARHDAATHPDVHPVDADPGRDRQRAQEVSRRPVRGHAWTRRKNIAMQRRIWLFCKRHPDRARR